MLTRFPGFQPPSRAARFFREYCSSDAFPALAAPGPDFQVSSPLSRTARFLKRMWLIRCISGSGGSWARFPGFQPPSRTARFSREYCSSGAFPALGAPRGIHRNPPIYIIKHTCSKMLGFRNPPLDPPEPPVSCNKTQVFKDVGIQEPTVGSCGTHRFMQ